ncbi:hypothetical protein [Methanogenium organophilum]|uniref:CARDB domain-containing protein n=1 Tax=Methanogenium organophilum TaxID=2199 RepID=A0A9X9S697_METOG|nr:hypothetical protein [Methanogenium organophilum]WAI02271.1 hypothetical protein OU421_05205 [Methanogenium organophilum]
MKSTLLPSYYIRLGGLLACLACVLLAAGCTDAQPKITVESSDITITNMDADSETIWYTMTVTVTNSGDASAKDVIAGVTLQTPDSTQMSRMAHESVEFGTIAPGTVRSETVTIQLEAGPVGYTDLVTNGESPVVSTRIEQMDYISLPI